MSQILRERIEGLTKWKPNALGGMFRSERGTFLELSDVLRILAEHEREQAPVGLGVHAVAQPLSKAEELPAWLMELHRLLYRLPILPDERELLTKLQDLDVLRRVILSGTGDAVIPEGLAQCMTIKGGGHHPAGIYRWDGDEWMHSTEGATYSASRDYALAALDSYADGLVRGA